MLCLWLMIGFRRAFRGRLASHEGAILSTVTTCGFEGLKLKSQQTIEGGLVAARRFPQTLSDGPLEQFEVLIIVTVETFLAHETPQALNQIEVGRIGRQKEEFDAQLLGSLEHEPTALIASIIHHHGNGGLQAKESDLLEQFAHAGRIDVAVIGHGYELVADGIQCSQDIEALPPTGGTHDHAGETP